MSVHPTPEPDANLASDPTILLTGATGYVGGRLLARFEHAGRKVRCLTRRPAELEPRLASTSTAVKADMLDADGLVEAMEGGDIAYYLVHSMGVASGFEDADRQAARNFGTAAKEAGVRRIVYLGGLG